MGIIIFLYLYPLKRGGALSDLGAKLGGPKAFEGPWVLKLA
jgi:hypothetical protein